MVAMAACSDPEQRTVVYDERFGDATSMNIFLPEGEGARPAVLLIHGGSFKYFDKESYTNFGQRFARSGYVAASVDYRLGSEGTFPRAVQDVGCALAYLENHADEFGIDPARIVVFGYSAGGYLASMVAVANEQEGIAPDCAEGIPSTPAAAISGSAPLDFVPLADAGPIEDFVGRPYEGNESYYEFASPLNHVDSGDVP